MGALLARYEWAVMALLAVGFGVWQLVSINRSIRRDRIAKDAALDREKR